MHHLEASTSELAAAKPVSKTLFFVELFTNRALLYSNCQRGGDNV
jgi:hypothetical protein